VNHVFKGAGGLRAYYAFIPIGDFAVAGKHICASSSDYATPPDIGAEVFVFTYPPDGEMLTIANAGDVVPVAADGELMLPRQYATEHPRGVVHSEQKMTKDDLIDRIGATLNEVEK
jgi:hypothetical protein